MGRFAELPNEIKDIILKHFFTGKLVQYIPCDARMSELKVRTLVNMLSVCRNLFGRRQVSEAMLRYSTIRIDQVEGLKHVQNMQPVHRKMIRKLQFAVKNDNLYAENIDVYLPNLSIIELVTGHVEIEAPTESQIFANFKSKPIGNIGYVLDEQCALDHGPQFDASRLTIASQDSMDPLASGAFEVGGIWCYDPGMWADSSYIVGFKIFDRGINSDARAFLERAVGAGIEVMVTVELSLHPAKDGLARQCGCGIKLPTARYSTKDPRMLLRAPLGDGELQMSQDASNVLPKTWSARGYHLEPLAGETEPGKYDWRSTAYEPHSKAHQDCISRHLVQDRVRSIRAPDE